MGVHIALVETRNKIATSLWELFAASGQGIKSNVELGVNAHLLEKMAVSFAQLESNSNERVQAMPIVLSKQLTPAMMASFEEAKEAELRELEAKAALLSQAEEQLESRMSGTLVDPAKAGDDQASRVMTAFMGVHADGNREPSRANHSLAVGHSRGTNGGTGFRVEQDRGRPGGGAHDGFK